jgi:hypothetical protein
MSSKSSKSLKLVLTKIPSIKKQSGEPLLGIRSDVSGLGNDFVCVSRPALVKKPSNEFTSRYNEFTSRYLGNTLLNILDFEYKIVTTKELNGKTEVIEELMRGCNIYITYIRWRKYTMMSSSVDLAIYLFGLSKEKFLLDFFALMSSPVMEDVVAKAFEKINQTLHRVVKSKTLFRFQETHAPVITHLYLSRDGISVKEPEGDYVDLTLHISLMPEIGASGSTIMIGPYMTMSVDFTVSLKDSLVEQYSADNINIDQLLKQHNDNVVLNELISYIG